MEIVYSTERLHLCVFNSRCLSAMSEVWGNDDVMGLCNGAIPHEKLPLIIEAYANCHHENGLSVYAVQEKTSGKIIGAAGFNLTEHMDTIELIYHFNRTSWGKGYATEAAAACLEIAKNHSGTHLITASADPQNQASRKILKKIGFTEMGTKWFTDTEQEEPYYELIVSDK
ncbi:GNAT family N-acetyltransferase [Sporosarcina sp. USHLN248]|uniref:GNAT family N-acetyltransferase n=1 Tax=Sporosarcina sp. USHLN248 TaxID=3081300 RepID=UPI00301764A4